MVVEVKELTVRVAAPRETLGFTFTSKLLPEIVIVFVLVLTMVLRMIEKICALSGSAEAVSNSTNSERCDATREMKRCMFFLSGIDTGPCRNSGRKDFRAESRLFSGTRARRLPRAETWLGRQGSERLYEPTQLSFGTCLDECETDEETWGKLLSVLLH